jgi:BirA family biotin operon repressor/biotin-[acetyl-CoA-carboxylase] ligase
MPICIHHWPTIDSTSLEARRMIDAGQVLGPTVLVADQQTGGLGRLGRRWFSPLGGLWFTLVVPRASDATIDPVMAIGAGLACMNAIESVGVRGALKWPNDVLINSRKVAGLLSEVVRRDDRAFVLIGVGVNANCTLHELPASLQERATTLRRELGAPVDLIALREAMLGALVPIASGAALDAGVVTAAQSRLDKLNEERPVTLPDGKMIRGVVRGLEPSGALRLEVDGEIRVIASGELG